MKRVYALGLLVLLFALHGTAYGGTDPEDRYTYLAGALPDTLHAAASPYMALADLYPSPACHVEAGVEVYFPDGIGLDLSGATQFECAGTISDPVLLQDAGLGPWSGVVVNATGTERNLVLEHTVIDGASVGVEIQLESSTINTRVELKHTSLSGCTTAGLMIVSNGGEMQFGLLTLDDLHFLGNERGLWIRDSYGSLPENLVNLQGGEASGNGYGFWIDGGSVTVNGFLIRDNTTYDVYVQTPVTQYPALDFKYNDWGPTTTVEMEAEGIFSDISTIYDWWDNHQYSLVDYSGFVGGSTGVAGARVVPTSWGSIKSMFK